jgi:hypothetical protein
MSKNIVATVIAIIVLLIVVLVILANRNNTVAPTRNGVQTPTSSVVE